MAQSPLFKLPAELRNNVYRLALLSESHIDVTLQDSINPPLLRTSREIRKESITIYYGESLFGVPALDCNSDLCMKWLVLETALRRQLKIKIRSYAMNETKVISRKTWTNLLTWLKRFHQRSVSCRGLSPSQKKWEKRPDLLTIGIMFEMVSKLRSQPWATVEHLLLEQYVVLKACNPKWSREA